LQELHNNFHISVNDINNINRLFTQRRILEIIIFRLITRIGLPLLNVKFKEYEIDILTLVDEPNTDGSGIRLIEVTTRKKNTM